MTCIHCPHGGDVHEETGMTKQVEMAHCLDCCEERDDWECLHEFRLLAFAEEAK